MSIPYVPGKFQYVSGQTSATWTVAMPLTPGTYEARLYLRDGFVLGATSSSVIAAVPVSTDEISPLQAVSGQLVTIRGQGFTSASRVMIGGTDAGPVEFASSSEVHFAVPFTLVGSATVFLAAGVYQVSVDNSNTIDLTVVEPPANPNAPGLVLNAAISDATGGFRAREVDIGAAIATLETLRADPSMLAVLTAIRASLPDIGLALDETLSAVANSLDGTSLAAVERTLLHVLGDGLLSRAEADRTAAASSQAPQLQTSALDSAAGDAWLDERKRLVTAPKLGQAMGAVLLACRGLPVCQGASALLGLVNFVLELPLAAHGDIAALRVAPSDVTIIKGTPTESVVTVQLPSGSSADMHASIVTKRSVRPFLPLKTAMDTIARILPLGLGSQAVEVVYGRLASVASLALGIPKFDLETTPYDISFDRVRVAGDCLTFGIMTPAGRTFPPKDVVRQDTFVCEVMVKPEFLTLVETVFPPSYSVSLVPAPAIEGDYHLVSYRGIPVGGFCGEADGCGGTGFTINGGTAHLTSGTWQMAIVATFRSGQAGPVVIFRNSGGLRFDRPITSPLNLTVSSTVECTGPPHNIPGLAYCSQLPPGLLYDFDFGFGFLPYGVLLDDGTLVSGIGGQTVWSK